MDARIALAGREVLLEFVPAGTSMKAVAVDAATGTEVVVVGPIAAGRHALERVACAKLVYRLRKDGAIR
ncbi:MAG: serine hydroxymethyltransferase [Alphaproteobacteria bacterium]|nr:serine hydroxymethyltransferase [Alphaproteobacteria bacterium]